MISVKKLSTGLRFPVIILMAILTISSVCWGLEVSPADKKAYYDALADTEVTTQGEICTKLLAIVPGWDPINNERLNGGEIRWEGAPGSSRILVGAFMSRASYQTNYAPYINDQEFRLKKSLWVTVVPEMKNFFLGRECPPSKERVRQLLGLNPAYPFEVLVEMWVWPKDLFRPSPDPEINDHEAMLATKDASGVWIFPFDNNPFVQINPQALYLDAAWKAPQTFKDWFKTRADTIYNRAGDDPSTWGDPWTRLGYTYDWGNPFNRIGLSEFLLRIDPDAKELVIKLEKAVDGDTPDWPSYFKCSHEFWFPLVFN